MALGASGRGGEVAVSLRGELDVVSASTALAVVAAAAIRGQAVVVDLAELDFLDCSAVDLLMRARVVAQESGGDVLLVNSRGSVLRTLTVLGLAEMPVEANSRSVNGSNPSSINGPASPVASNGSPGTTNEPALPEQVKMSGTVPAGGSRGR